MAAHVADSPAQVHLLDGALGTELGRRGVATRGGLFSAAALLDERGLAARFGEPYIAYTRRVKRWIPGVL